MTSRLRPGIIAALAVIALDQVSKLWLLRVLDIARRGAVKVIFCRRLCFNRSKKFSDPFIKRQRHLVNIQLFVVEIRSHSPN